MLAWIKEWRPDWESFSAISPEIGLETDQICFERQTASLFQQQSRPLKNGAPMRLFGSGP